MTQPSNDPADTGPPPSGGKSGHPDNSGHPAPLDQPPAGYPGSPEHPPAGYPPGLPSSYPGQPGFPQTGYPGQPGFPQAGYPGQAGYPPPGYPGQPGYPPPGQVPPGYPPPGYGPYGTPGYPGLPVQDGLRRPGTVTAAAVLAYVQAGLIILAGLGTFGNSGSRYDDDFFSFYLLDRDMVQWMAGAALVAGGLLIAGGVSAQRGRSLLLLVGAGGSLAISLWWLIALEFEPEVMFWAVFLAAMPIISISLVLSGGAIRWMALKSATGPR